MPLPWVLICLVFALVLFVVAGAWAPEPPWKSRLVAFGLAFWVLADLLSRSLGH